MLQVKVVKKIPKDAAAAWAGGARLYIVNIRNSGLLFCYHLYYQGTVFAVVSLILKCCAMELWLKAALRKSGGQILAWHLSEPPPPPKTASLPRPGRVPSGVRHGALPRRLACVHVRALRLGLHLHPVGPLYSGPAGCGFPPAEDRTQQAVPEAQTPLLGPRGLTDFPPEQNHAEPGAEGRGALGF